MTTTSLWLGVAFAAAFLCIFFFVLLPQLIGLVRWFGDLHRIGRLRYLWMPWKWRTWRDDGDQPVSSSTTTGPNQP